MLGARFCSCPPARTVPPYCIFSRMFSFVPMPYLPSYSCNVLRPSLDLSLLSLSSLCLSLSLSPSPMLNACSHSMLAEGTQFRILCLVHGQFCVQHYRAWAIGPNVDPGDAGWGNRWGWWQFSGNSWRSIAIAIVLVDDSHEWSPFGCCMRCCLM